MAAVTQLVENFLGGVSTQNDDKKLPGQVRNAVNAYPDPTFGMQKRNGMRFIRTINKQDGTPFTDAELNDAAWFFVQRGPTEAFFGAIKGTNIYVWNSVTGEFCTVDNQGADYLTGTKPNDYSFRTIQDVTVVTNRTVAPELQPKGEGYHPKRVGTVALRVVEYSANYTVTVNGSDYTYRTRNADVFEQDSTDTRLNADEILNGIQSALGGSGLNVTKLETSLELSSDSDFTLSVKGGINNRALESFQGTITNVSILPADSVDNRVVEVLNAGGDEDNYWLKFSADTKEWKESRDPASSPGFVASTMPHELVFTSDNELKFQPIPWTERLVGDDVTNPPPSIFTYDPDTDSYVSPGNPITATFFYNNRFGMLSADNVILSQSNDPYNFFARSATTQIASDPIDLNAASVRPVELFNVLPDSQGLLLFSKRQQFLLFANDTAVLTPNTAVIRGLANYEMEDTIEPVEVGTTAVFISKVPSYTRTFSMQTRGLEEPPIVLDLSKVVSNYIPGNIDTLISSPQNSFVALSGKDTADMYIYRYYNNGEKDLFQAWTKWTLPGDIQDFDVANDMMFIITEQMDQYTLGVISVNDIPLGTKFDQVTPDSMSNPTIDMAVRPTSITYDASTNKTTMAIPYIPLDYKEPILILAPELESTAPTSTFDLAGFNSVPNANTEDSPGFWKVIRTVGDNFEVDGDWTGYADNMVVGYNYEFSLDLPTFYYNRAQEGSIYDYTASLTIARAKISCGKTGAISFKLKSKGSDEWVDIQSITDASYYQADTLPVNTERRFTVPINQRNMNFDLKITSDLPFPVSLVSMMWEGQYTPRYYQRS